MAKFLHILLIMMDGWDECFFVFLWETVCGFVKIMFVVGTLLAH